MHFLNVYNKPAGFANLELYASSIIPYLADHADRMPHITFMCGDFNARHRMWDKRNHMDETSNPRHKEMGDDLISLALSEMGLSLVNKSDGPPTWRSTDSTKRPGVLDLVWMDAAYRNGDLTVDMGSRGGSDHAVISWTVGVEASPDCPPP